MAGVRVYLIPESVVEREWKAEVQLTRQPTLTALVGPTARGEESWNGVLDCEIMNEKSKISTMRESYTSIVMCVLRFNRIGASVRKRCDDNSKSRDRLPIQLTAAYHQIEV